MINHFVLSPRKPHGKNHIIQALENGQSDVIAIKPAKTGSVEYSEDLTYLS